MLEFHLEGFLNKIKIYIGGLETNSGLNLGKYT